jgi:hypothetical protein
MKGNGHKTETPDVSHIRNVEVTHEASDINVRAVLVFVAVLTVTTVAVSIGMWLLFRFFNDQEARQEPKRGPMAVTTKEGRLPPEPRLQAAPGFGEKLPGQAADANLQLKPPQAEYWVLKKYWDQALNGELKDQAGATVGVPIKDAMQQVVSGQGLPVRAQPAPDGAISSPTAESSGRLVQKRLQ